MVTGEVLVVDSTDNWPDAARDLLYGTPDLLIVSGILKAKDFDYLTQASDKPVLDRLYEDIPSLHELDETVARYWSERGYNDYELISPRLIRGHISTGSMGTHTDYPSSYTNQLAGPLSASFCTVGRAMYYAQKPEHSFIMQDGSFDVSSWRKWKHGRSPSPPRSSAIQETGDVAFFTNHPLQSHHEISALERPRVAALLDYMVRKI
jgi:hypothetical protein